MAKKASVYTKTGDQGTTGLVSGARISKADKRIDLYGETDSLMSRIGLVICQIEADQLLADSFEQDIVFLKKIQSALFDIGSNLACEVQKRSQYKLPQVELPFITDIEKEIDKLNEVLPELKNFILPGGHLAAAELHICRVDCRKLERKLISFKEKSAEELPINSEVFVNRLSDYFFIFARSINHKRNIKEQAWTGRS